MSRKNILVVTRRQDANSNLNQWLGRALPFHISVAVTDEEAIELCHLQQFDIVVVDAPDKEIDSKKLKAVLPILQEKLLLIAYEGEAPELLTQYVESIFSAQKYKRILGMILPEPGEGSLPEFSLN